jgi:hypothetical protein
MPAAPVNAALLDALWPAADRTAELPFFQRTGAVITALYEARLAGEWEQAAELQRCLGAARELWRAEPQASILDNAFAQGTAYLANGLAARQRFEEALDQTAAGWAVLDSKDQRRSKLGLPPSPSTSVRVQLLTALADAKWRLPAGHTKAVLPADQHLAAYRKLGSAIDAARDRIHPTTAQEVSFGMVWAGLGTAIVVLRYCPDRLDQATAEFNRWHRRRCGFPAIASTDQELAAARSSPWHWHYEIAKFWLTGPAASGAAGAITKLGALYDALEGAIGGLPELQDPVYLHSVAEDRRWMMEMLRLGKLQLVEVASAAIASSEYGR